MEDNSASLGNLPSSMKNSPSSSSKHVITIQDAHTVMKNTIQEQSKSKDKKKKASVMLFVSKDMNNAESVNKYDEVYPGLFLGDQTLARDKEKLKTLNITHIVNTAQGEAFFMIDTTAAYYADLGCQFFGFAAKDVSKYDMSQHFTDAAKFINEALQSDGRIYVHCFHGISRSASVVLAFLMLHRNMSLLEALEYVRTRRPIRPNDGFLEQLVKLNNSLNLRCNSDVETASTVV